MRSLEQTICECARMAEANRELAKYNKSHVDRANDLKNAEECEQLAAWLRELQEHREKDNKIGRGNARWLINSDGYYPYCSACMTEPKDGIMTDFCPSCGAKMEGKIT